MIMMEWINREMDKGSEMKAMKKWLKGQRASYGLRREWLRGQRSELWNRKSTEKIKLNHRLFYKAKRCK
jgi:hypothetical protein